MSNTLQSFELVYCWATLEHNFPVNACDMIRLDNVFDTNFLPACITLQMLQKLYSISIAGDYWGKKTREHIIIVMSGDS